MKVRELSANGLDFIKSHEGCRLVAYKVQDSDKYYTIGYGHYGADVEKGSRISMSQAKALLKSDCERFVTHVNRYMETYNFNQNQFDAMVSFAYNVGNISGLTSDGTLPLENIPGKMLLYCNSNGKKLAGLVARRRDEKALFETPVSTPALKSVDEISDEVIKGLWGNGESRKKALEKCGYNYSEIQKAVNEKKKNENATPGLKPLNVIVDEVIKGVWGNGNARKIALSKAGYNYSEIQKAVNEKKKGGK